MQRLPEPAIIADAKPVVFREVSSAALGVADLFALRDLMVQTAEEDPNMGGFVVLHGTGTLEETAFFRYLTLPCPYLW